MPEVSRKPSSVYEDRINFERIGKAQDRRHRDTLQELRRLLREIERRTIAWVQKELVRKKRRAAPAKYSMPLAPKYREILRRRTLASHRRGRGDVTAEVGAKRAPAMRAPALNQVRRRADLLAKEHQARLEADLKRAWSKAMEGKTDEEQLIYETRRTFADFAGWKQPVP